tara:strand:- start:1672 stop:2076 length:405 start_codon:yes stop_codon:yes gene_type:complete
MFPASPIYSGQLTDAERTDAMQKLALDNVVTSGFGLNSFNRDFSQNDPPNLAEVETGGGGLPATPFVPNPTSPGPGSVFAGDQAPYEGEIPASTPEYGSGLGGTTSPSVTSAEIEKQTLGSYISGRSYAGSDGT